MRSHWTLKLIDARATLARGLAELGRYDEARRALARAIELAPEHPLLYYQWGYVTRWTADDPRLAALEALARKSASLPLEHQACLNFALGKAYADCGDIDRAFRRQIDGGALMRRTLRYDEATTLRGFDELCQALDAEWHRTLPGDWRSFAATGVRSRDAALGYDLGRTGPGQPPQGPLAWRARDFRGGARPKFADCRPSRHRSQTWQRGGQARSCAGLARFISKRRGVTRPRPRPASPTRRSETSDLSASFTPPCPTRASSTRPATPSIHVYPPSRSCFPVDSNLYSYALGELGRYYRAYEKVMAHWRAVLPGGVLLEVRYEDVVDDLERQARRIIAHCGLEWDDACLEFHKTDRPVRSASHAQVRQPIYRSSVGRQRPRAELLLPLLEALGVG